ncbi:MAG: trypsin-like peptidase domain-containing protein [Candidatus Dependentiae bacterium]|jgi:S1-C subfamily serine protease
MTLFTLTAPLTAAGAGQDYLTYAHADWESIQNVSKRSVVQVINYVGKDRTFEPFKHDRDDEQGIGTGTAFFIDAETGEMLTNYHVIEGGERLEIMMPGHSKSERFQVEVVGAQPALDVALLRLTPEAKKRYETFLDTVPGCAGEIQTTELGDSDLLRPTSQVMALGFPLAAEIKRTIGYLNGISYSWKANYMHYQIDAAVNPGNSGGPVYDKTGRVVGIVVAKNLQSDNTGWMIPINYVKNLLAGMRTYGILTTDMGAQLQKTTKELRDAYRCNKTGIRVTHVRPNSAAERAGLRVNDIIVEVDNHTVDDDGQVRTDWIDVKVSFREIFNRVAIDDTVEVKVIRDSSEHTLLFTIPAKTNAAIRDMFFPLEKLDYRAFGGLVIQPLRSNHIQLAVGHKNNITNPALFTLLQDSTLDHEELLIISKVYRHSHADDQRILKAGDIITSVNGTEVRTLSDLDAVLLSNTGDHITFMTQDNQVASLHLPTVRDREVDLVAAHKYKELVL